MANNYWNDKHEKLVKCWVSADTRQQFHIYNKLLNAVYQMAASILYRYYHKYDEIKILEAISDLYINMHHYNPDKGKAYSFCQTLIKNNYNEAFSQKKQRFLDLSYSDTLPEYGFNQFTDEDDKSYRKGLDKLYKSKDYLQYRLTDFTGNNAEMVSLRNEYVILSNLILFLIEYKDSDRNITAILENVAVMSCVSESLVNKHMLKYIGVSARPNYDRQSTIDKKYEKVGMLDDDYCGSEAWHRKNRRDKVLKLKTFQTF